MKCSGASAISKQLTWAMYVQYACPYSVSITTSAQPVGKRIFLKLYHSICHYVSISFAVYDASNECKCSLFAAVVVSSSFTEIFPLSAVFFNFFYSFIIRLLLIQIAKFLYIAEFYSFG